MKRPGFSALRCSLKVLGSLALLAVGLGFGRAEAAPTIDTFQFLPLVLSRFTPGPGNIEGQVLDTNSRSPISEATICYQMVCTQTNNEGRYTLTNIPAGWRLVNASMVDYDTASTGVNVHAGQTVTLDIALSKSLGSKIEFRIVVTWSTNPDWGPPLYVPNDLDAHLWLDAAISYHVYYDNPGYTDIYPYAHLEQDYRQGFGPETIDIWQLQNFTYYHFAVNNVNYGYEGVPGWAGTQAQVQVYTQEGLFRTYNAPSSGTDPVWYVFRMDQTGTITDMNCVTNWTVEDPPDDTHPTPPVCP